MQNKLTKRINIWEEKYLTQTEKQNIERVYGNNPEWGQIPTHLRKEVENRIIDEAERKQELADDDRADELWAELAEKEKRYWFEMTRGAN